MDGDWGGARVRQGADREKPGVTAVSVWMGEEQEGDSVAAGPPGEGGGGLLPAADKVDPEEAVRR
jgi:hypothetical protein